MSKEEKRICQGVSQNLLDSQVSDYHIAEVANDLVEWEDLGPFLDLTESEQKEIVKDFKNRYNLQKRQVLHMWKQKNGEKATYRALISICCSRELIKLAETIASYPSSKQQVRSSQIINTFHQYLLDCYVDSPHPSRRQWPGNKFPIHASPTYVELNLLEAPLHENKVSGKIEIKEVTLKSVLSKREEQRRMIVYFEGIAGSGKTTLSWYACREWAEKRLLRDIQLLIHLQLNDPQVHSATCLSDIIPYPDTMLRQDLVTAIVDCKGRGICFLLDGLDEASTNLLDFLLQDLMNGRLGFWQLPELSFILTSRPDARVTERLESVISSRIIMSGFSRENLDKLLENHPGATSEEREMLVEQFKINPRLEGLCSHPINASIMTFLAHFLKKSTPTSQTDLFKPLICNFLLRHMSKHFDTPSSSCMIQSLVDDGCIPSEIRKPFGSMCSLAYFALYNNKRLFTKEELDHADLNDTLGLLQVRSTVTMFGSKRFYSFSHMSIQEFLAAIHLARMEVDQQLNEVEKIINKFPRSQILSFYAGLTGLKNKKVFKILSKSLEKAKDGQTAIENLIATNGKGDPQQEALLFLTCLFESKNESLWKLPESDLHENILSIIHEEEQDNLYEAVPVLPHSPKVSIQQTQAVYSLTLSSLALTPLDCLSLGNYIHAKSSVHKSQTLLFDLSCCAIDPIGIRLLFTELKKCINYRTEVRVNLVLAKNKFTKESVLSLKELVRGQSNLESLSLIDCFDPLLIDLNLALKSLIEGLSDNTSCRNIILSLNHFDSFHIYYFILMLISCSQIDTFELHYYDLSKVMPLFCSVLPFTTITSLTVSYCNISDSELILLGTEIIRCKFLMYLSINGNPFTDRGLCTFLTVLRSSMLVSLMIGHSLKQDQLKILQDINYRRLFFGYPPLDIDSHMTNERFQKSVDNDVSLDQFRHLKDSLTIAN